MLSGLLNRLRSMTQALVTKFSQERAPKDAMYEAQIEILMERLKRDKDHFKFTPEERAKLLAAGVQLDHQVDDCILIASPKTYRRWLREAAAGKEPGRVGRKRACQSIRDLILRMARETAWGYRRLVGEAKKLGAKVSATCVKHILKREGIHPDKGARARWQPSRNWQTFIDSHMSSLLGCDFMCVRILTIRGWVDAFVFVVIHLESRRVLISPATFSPNHLWLKQ